MLRPAIYKPASIEAYPHTSDREDHGEDTEKNATDHWSRSYPFISEYWIADPAVRTSRANMPPYAHVRYWGETRHSHSSC
jgi:hypothetical protein